MFEGNRKKWKRIPWMGIPWTFLVVSRVTTVEELSGLVCHRKPWTYIDVPQGADPLPRSSNCQGDSAVPMAGPVTCSSSSSPDRIGPSSLLYRTAAGLASPVQTLHCYPLSENYLGASLVAQWQRICLLTQEMWVWSLVWEDSTCLGATKPCEPQLLSLCSRAWEPQLWKPISPRAHALQQEKPQQREACPLRQSPPRATAREKPAQ